MSEWGPAILLGSAHPNRALTARAGRAHERKPAAVDGGFLQDLAVAAAGGDLARVGLPECDSDDRFSLEIHQTANGKAGQRVDTHLTKAGGRASLVRPPVVDRAVYQLEDLPAE